MKTLLLISTLILGSAFASGSATEAVVNEQTGDLSITVRGEVAKNYYEKLDVLPEPGLGTARLKTNFKKGENIKCTAVSPANSVKNFFKSAMYKSKMKKWFECSMNIGSADPDAVEKICGPKPVNPSKAKYSCLLTLDNEGRASIVK